MKQLFTLLCCLISFSGMCQPITTTYSAPFEEPEVVGSKVMQMKNGNTFLFGFTKSDGIEVTLFDNQHKKISRQTLKGAGLWDSSSMVPGLLSGLSKGSKICGIHAVGDEAVLFLEQLDDRAPMLIRIELSAKDGKLIRQEKIAEMPAYPKGAAYAIVFGHVAMKTFYVEADQETGDYAVAAFDGFAHETDHRLEIIHYNNQHKLLGRRFYDSPEMSYKYINYLGMAVEGDKAVHISTYCFGGNKNTSGGTKIVLSRLSTAGLEHHPIEFTRNLENARACMVYNPVKKQIMLLTMTIQGESAKMFSSNSKVTYSQLLLSIDPQTYMVTYAKSPTMSLARKYRKVHYADDDELQGIPMNLVINKDGSATAVVEDNVEVWRASSSGNSHLDYTNLNDMVVTDYNDGTETNGYVIRKSQRADNAMIPFFAQQDYRKNRMTFSLNGWIRTSANVGFYSFEYLTTTKGRFVIFNDHPENFDRDLKKSPKTLIGVSDANTAVYRLTEGEMTRSYLFGTPDANFDNRFAMISSGNYSENTGDYAVLIIEKNGKKKNARVAWVRLADPSNAG